MIVQQEGRWRGAFKCCGTGNTWGQILHNNNVEQLQQKSFDWTDRVLELVDNVDINETF